MTRERSDTERLDQLARNGASIHCNFTSPDDYTVTPTGPDCMDLEPIHGRTLREAIDKWLDAMNEEESGRG